MDQMNNEEISIVYCALLGRIVEINKLIEVSQRHKHRGWHEDCSPPPPPWGGEGGIPLGYPIVPAPSARCQDIFQKKNRVFSHDFP